MWKKLPDHFFFGMLLGTVGLFLSWLLVRVVRSALVNYYGNEYMMAQPRVQLFAILINLIFFRFVMVRFEKEKTGRGMLLSTVVLAFLYFYLLWSSNFQMP